MKKQDLKNRIFEDKAITLVSLVIAIIILIILAGISLRVTLGKNGLFNRAQQAKEEYSGAVNIEQDELEKAEKLLNNSGSITGYVKVGDYVDYDPTKSNLEKTQDVEENKLKYESPIGGYDEALGKMTHGNGNSVQNFKAKPNDGTENGMRWRVLNVANDKVELISEDIVKTETGGNFILKGGTAYLFAEQELNEVCKIYGYGYGADTSRGSNYTVGGPEDTLVKGKIEGTGARCITISDINKKAGITEKDYKRLNSKYGNTENPKTEIYYPTLNSTNTKNQGQSAEKKAEFTYTRYTYTKDEIKDETIKDMLFNGTYWLIHRSTLTADEIADFVMGYVKDPAVGTCYLCSGNADNLSQRVRDEYGVRVIVTIKSTNIEFLESAENSGTKENPWKLK